MSGWRRNDDLNSVTRQLLAQDGGGVADLGSVGWGSAAPAPRGGYGAFGDTVDSPVGIAATRSQADMLREQDKGLDNLHQIVVRQRAIAENIESEVGIILVQALFSTLNIFTDLYHND